MERDQNFKAHSKNLRPENERELLNLKRLILSYFPILFEIKNLFLNDGAGETHRKVPLAFLWWLPFLLNPFRALNKDSDFEKFLVSKLKFSLQKPFQTLLTSYPLVPLIPII